jgi:hypothetical protein
MASIDRRTFLRATTTIAAGAVAPGLTLATDNKNKELMASPSPSTPHVTKTLASYIASARYGDLPDNVRKEGLRTLLNWVGVPLVDLTTKPSTLRLTPCDHSQDSPNRLFLDAGSVST